MVLVAVDDDAAAGGDCGTGLGMGAGAAIGAVDWFTAAEDTGAFETRENGAAGFGNAVVVPGAAGLEGGDDGFAATAWGALKLHSAVAEAAVAVAVAATSCSTNVTLFETFDAEI